MYQYPWHRSRDIWRGLTFAACWFTITVIFSFLTHSSNGFNSQPVKRYSQGFFLDKGKLNDHFYILFSTFFELLNRPTNFHFCLLRWYNYSWKDRNWKRNLFIGHYLKIIYLDKLYITCHSKIYLLLIRSLLYLLVHRFVILNVRLNLFNIPLYFW